MCSQFVALVVDGWVVRKLTRSGNGDDVQLFALRYTHIHTHAHARTHTTQNGNSNKIAFILKNLNSITISAVGWIA
jgi:hypothetical protein